VNVPNDQVANELRKAANKFGSKKGYYEKGL